MSQMTPEQIKQALEAGIITQAQADAMADNQDAAVIGLSLIHI